MSAKMLDLPAELLDEIFALCDKKSLKALRQTCTKLSSATSWLFRSFTLYPHLDSLDILCAISKHPNISGLVKTLDYETAYWCLPRIKAGHFKATREDVIASLQKIHESTLVGGNPSDELTQMHFLQESMPQLINLQTIRVHGVPSGRELPDFYRSRLPNKATWCSKAWAKLKADLMDEPEPKQTYALMMLAGAKSLNSVQSFQITGIQWDDFMGHPGLFARPLLFKDSLRGLKTLDLRASEDYTDHLWDGDVVFNLQTMLQLCTSLESLTVWLRCAAEIYVGGETCYDYTYDEHCESIFQHNFEDEIYESRTPSKCSTQLNWSPNLRSFNTKGLVITMSELKNILKQLAPALRELTMSDLIVLPHSRRGSRPCLIRLFRWMRRYLQLQSIGLEGTWCNGGRQNITFSNSSNTSCLRKKLEDFVTSQPSTEKQECPLSFMAIEHGDFDHGSGRYSASIPQQLQEKMDGRCDTRGDDSVAIRYDDFDDVPSEDEDDDDTDSEEGSYDSEAYAGESVQADSDWESATEEEDDDGDADDNDELEEEPY